MSKKRPRTPRSPASGSELGGSKQDPGYWQKRLFKCRYTYKGKQFEVPLIRLGFPIFDRHHLHRMTTLGYEGAMYMLTTLVNAVLERLDEETRGMGTTDYNYDLVR